MSITDKILSAEQKLVALRRVASGLEQELERIKTSAAKPVSADRNFKKDKRIQAFANFYMRRKIKIS